MGKGEEAVKLKEAGVKRDTETRAAWISRVGRRRDRGPRTRIVEEAVLVRVTRQPAGRRVVPRRTREMKGVVSLWITGKPGLLAQIMRRAVGRGAETCPHPQVGVKAVGAVGSSPSQRPVGREEGRG